ncbi:hypothetical protein Mame01_23550 [Microbispora amethystogenes]|nr:hypothetical protein Mame01_23550 [Microbispora amethystogenes]
MFAITVDYFTKFVQMSIVPVPAGGRRSGEKVRGPLTSLSRRVPPRGRDRAGVFLLSGGSGVSGWAERPGGAAGR